MPELPEVETIKNELTPDVVGRRITKIEFCWEGIAREAAPADFKKRTAGRKILSLGRRGKYLLFELDSGDTMLIHLKMSGALLVRPEKSGIEKYARAIVHLDNGTVIQFRDPRKFGRMYLVDNPAKITGKLGPEALGDEFTAARLVQIMEKRTAPVKSLLLDQELIAGIGNMYADEALYEAKIHPARPAASLTKREVERLYKAIRNVLRQGIKNKGASIENYMRPNGEPGTAHMEFKVAHGKGKTCGECGGPVERIVVRGRGTYFCPKCQKL